MNWRFVVTIAYCGILTACTSTWSLVNHKNQAVKLNHISLEIPIGWVFYNDHHNTYTAVVNGEATQRHVKRIIITKNGFNLDVIDIVQFKLHNAFPSVGRAIQESTLPLELAELYVAEQKIQLGIDSVEILENEPIVIAGYDGFKVHLLFYNSSGLAIEQMTYGFTTNNYFYAIKFRAPALHYFDAGLTDFKHLVNSIKRNS